MPDHSTHHSISNNSVAIIGGGLAGCAAGAVLTQSGWPATIIEKDTFPRDKLCGEFLSGESGRLLRRIGCLDQLLKHDPPRITEVRFITVSGKHHLVPLPHPAYGISRQLLDDTLFRHAAQCGATCLEGWEVSQLSNDSVGSSLTVTERVRPTDNSGKTHLIHPALTLAAYGRHSKIDRDLKRPFISRMEQGIGLKLHHRITSGETARATLADLNRTAEIYGIDGGYCGVCRIEGDRVNVCMLLQQRAFQRIGSSDWRTVTQFLAAQNRALALRLSTLTPCSDRVLTVSGMPFTQKEQSIDNVLFLGDAAGMIVPLCGDGQAMALESGIAAAQLIISHFGDPENLGRQVSANGKIATEWTRLWQRQFRNRMRLGRALQLAMFQPQLATAAITALRLAPASLTRRLAAATRSTG